MQDAIEYATQQDTIMVGLSAKGSAFQGLGFKAQGFGPILGFGFRPQASEFFYSSEDEAPKRTSAFGGSSAILPKPRST